MTPSFSLAWLLIPFAVVLLVATVFFFFNIFHLKRYAIRSSSSSLLIFGYFVSFGLIVVVILGYLSSVNWSQSYTAEELVPELPSPNQSRFDLEL